MDKSSIYEYDAIQQRGAVLTVTTSVTPTTAITVPPNAKFAYIQPQGGDVWLTQDGRTPDAGSPPVGKKVIEDAERVYPIQDFRNLKLIALGTVYLDIEFLS